MKQTIVFLWVMLVFVIGQSAFASVPFRCEGNKSRLEDIQGRYDDENNDSTTLRSSSLYGIYNKGDYGSPLTLKLDYKKRKKGALRDHPIQFVAEQSDDLGATTTIFAIQQGIFSKYNRNVGRKFKALLVTNTASELDCEIVSSVDLKL